MMASGHRGQLISGNQLQKFDRRDIMASKALTSGSSWRSLLYCKRKREGAQRGPSIHVFGLLMQVHMTAGAANATDPVLGVVPAARRWNPAATRSVYQFNIHLQGEHETVFFDV
jgi:hypothetical protein